jgi:hypothetical protein
MYKVRKSIVAVTVLMACLGVSRLVLAASPPSVTPAPHPSTAPVLHINPAGPRITVTPAVPRPTVTSTAPRLTVTSPTPTPTSGWVIPCLHTPEGCNAVWKKWNFGPMPSLNIPCLHTPEGCGPDAQARSHITPPLGPPPGAIFTINAKGVAAYLKEQSAILHKKLGNVHLVIPCLHTPQGCSPPK